MRSSSVSLGFFKSFETHEQKNKFLFCYLILFFSKDFFHSCQGEKCIDRHIYNHDKKKKIFRKTVQRINVPFSYITDQED